MSYTDEQIEDMRKVVAAADEVKAEEARVAREAYMLPVRDVVSSDHFQIVLDQLDHIRSNYEDDGTISIHVNALADIMPRLRDIVGVPAQAAPAPESETAE